MASEPANNQEPTLNRRVTNKRKRETPASRIASRSSKSNTPNAYARRTPPPEPTPITADSDNEDEPRQLKRPGAASRLTAASREAADRARRQREAEQARARVESAQASVGGTAAIAEHYNAVPERGRQWRQSDSRIKGLRSLNNWIKSTLIQKFSRPDVPTPALRVLDMACGKGGDLGKWEKAPQVPVLYVGCDIANVSVEQARERYAQSQRNAGRWRRGGQAMQAEFYVHDAFGRPLSEVPAVQAVGFNPNAGPGGGVIQGGMMSGNWDVVSMMFALHYSFETEELARGMLRNVAGALKKGGRFLGVMPDSDVISLQVKRLLTTGANGDTMANGAVPRSPKVGSEDGETVEDDWDPEKPSGPTATADDEDDWDPEKPSEGAAVNGDGADDGDWDPEKPSETTVDGADVKANGYVNGVNRDDEDGSRSPLYWGNDIYNIRFPRQQLLTKRPLPKDGIFRPPFGWKYNYTLEEAVNQPEYVVPWEAFRALAEDYGLELMYRKNFRDVLQDEASDRELGVLAERMNVLRNGKSLVTPEEMEAASFYHAFCFYKT